MDREPGGEFCGTPPRAGPNSQNEPLAARPGTAQSRRCLLLRPVGKRHGIRTR